MKNNFIPYEQSLALKELGFDEECFAYCNSKFKKDLIKEGLNGCTNSSLSENEVALPLYQQAFKWFREKYKLSGEPQSSQFSFEYNIIYDTLGENICKSVSKKYQTYEEAKLDCLNKLIEIAQKEKTEEK